MRSEAAIVTVHEVLARFELVKQIKPDHWTADCPTHQSKSRKSLGITRAGQRILVHCFGGCETRDVLAAVGLTLADLFDDDGARADTPPPEGQKRVVAVYAYHAPDGSLAYEVVRYDPKDFRPRLSTPDGWVFLLSPTVPRWCYRLLELMGKTRVYWVEGEGCADALWAAGIPATTGQGGSSAWRPEYAEQLKAIGVLEVIVLPDADKPGEKYALQALAAFRAVGLTARIVRLWPTGPSGADVADWLAVGHTMAELQTLADAGDAWPQPNPVPSDLAPVPPFDIPRMMPAALAPWIADIADRAQCPPDFLGIATLVAIGAVVGRTLAIRPKRHDDWTVVPNLWGIAIGRPGVMKTPALEEALRPLHRLVLDARKDHEQRLAAHAFTLAEAQARLEVAKKALKEAVSKGLPTEALRDAFTAPLPPAPTERRYLVNDATVEKLGELLNQNPNGLFLFRDELVGWMRTLDREGHENDRAFYCEAWTGTASYTYDRIGRGTLVIAAACVSILGGMTPGPLHAYLREVFAHGATDDGTIQRFQLIAYPDVATEWRNVDRWPDTAAKRCAFEVFTALAALDLGQLQAHRPEKPGDGLPFLHFTPEAQDRFDAWRAELEHRLRTADDHPVVISHLAKYRSLMPSLALLFHLVDCVDRDGGGPVSLAAAERAIVWCGYLEAHARRVYESVTASRRLAAAALARKLQAGKLQNPFRARDVLQAEWSGLTDAEEVHAGLALLEELHWIRATDVPPSGKGGRPTVEYEINPTVSRLGAGP